MRLLGLVAVVANLCGSVLSQSWAAIKYYDPTSGITYSSSTLPNGVSYRIALPINSPTSDAIIQIVAPNKYGWCGFAWGGHMTGNPLSVAWPSKATTGQKVVISNRMASGYGSTPGPYAGASHTYLPSSPSTATGTHWTVTARCQGCTRWGGNNVETWSNAWFAYACSTAAPATPASNTSSFSVHETPGRWKHDLNIAKNQSFSSWVAEL